LLRASGAEVIWNDRVNDPDNPGQLRQIDVSVKRGEDLSIIECRHHKRPQDVKWVEELYGRRTSLNAVQVIAVSSSGFTEGAKKKGDRLGVFLRSLVEISDKEAAQWGRRTDVILKYAAVSNIKIYFVCSDRLSVPLNSNLVRRAFRNPSLDFLVSTVARDAPRTGLGEGPIVTRMLDVPSVFLGSIRIRELFTCFEWRMVEREQALPVLLSYVSHNDGHESDLGSMEASKHCGTSIIYSEDEVTSIVDVGVQPFHPSCYLCGAEVRFRTPVKARVIEVIGLERLHSDVMEADFEAIYRTSPVYQWLLKSSSGPKQWTREM